MHVFLHVCRKTKLQGNNQILYRLTIILCSKNVPCLLENSTLFRSQLATFETKVQCRYIEIMIL